MHHIFVQTLLFCGFLGRFQEFPNLSFLLDLSTHLKHVLGWDQGNQKHNDVKCALQEVK
jgi:hypothetical protein